MVSKAPPRHDGATAADDAGHAIACQRYIGQENTGVNGHIVHALFALLDDGIAEDLPGQILCYTIDLFQSLVDGHGANGNRGIAQDPLAGGVDIVTGGKVHYGVCAPLGGPAQFGYFFLDRGCDRRVANIGIDFGKEFTPNDHGLRLRVVDIIRDNGAAASHLSANEFRIAVLTQCYEFHFAGDDSLAGVVHLGNAAPRQGLKRRALRALPLLGRRPAALCGTSIVGQLAAAAGVFFGISALANPLAAQGRKSLFWCAFWPTRAIDAEGFIGALWGILQLDFGLWDL